MLLQGCFKDCGCDLSLLNREAGQVPQGDASVLHTQSIDWFQSFEPKPKEMTPTKRSSLNWQEKEKTKLPIPEVW